MTERAERWKALVWEMFARLNPQDARTLLTAIAAVRQGRPLPDAYDYNPALQIVASHIRMQALSRSGPLAHAEREKALGLLEGLARVKALMSPLPGAPEENSEVAKGKTAKGRPGARTSAGPWAGLTDGEFVQFVVYGVEGRYPRADEIEHWRTHLSEGMSREEVIEHVTRAYLVNWALPNFKNEAPRHDGRGFTVMGTNRYVNMDDWRRSAAEARANPDAPDRFRTRFEIEREPEILVSVITSMYKGRKYIDQFMKNMVEQTIFQKYVELIIVDASSPQGEYEIIKEYIDKYPNIVYKRTENRIGIYDAWNVGVQLSRGKYLTNANVDDIRRADSLERQASILENLPFVDVVYQDFYYTMDHDLTFDGIAKYNFKSDLPTVTFANMMHFNSPHNAPMWRKRLHDELGMFDERYESAGDYEFWMRCLAANKTFLKCNDPHVSYYQNPEGLSTRPDSRGHDEALIVSRTFGRKLVSSAVTCDLADFTSLLNPDGDSSGASGASRYHLVQRALRNASIRNRLS